MDDARQPVLSWAANKDEWLEAVRFVCRVISADEAYISHGEIQAGLSLDGKTWAPDLERRFLEDAAPGGESSSLALARDHRGAIVGAAYVSWSFETPDAPFATLQDLAVEPPLRSQGLGGLMAAFVEAEAARRGAKWLFLESGKNNVRAHAFFERAGFSEISHVFVKQLSA